MTLKNKATLLAALIGAGLIVLGTAWKERTKPEPTDTRTSKTLSSGSARTTASKIQGHCSQDRKSRSESERGIGDD